MLCFCCAPLVQWVCEERLANHTPSPCFSHLWCCTVPALSATPLEGRAATYYRVPLPSHLSLESGALLVHMKLTITRGWAKLRVKEGVVPTQYVYTRAATGNTWSVSADTLRNEGLYAGVIHTLSRGLFQHIGTLSWKYLILCRACASVQVCRCGSESV